ncbi:trigger factor [Synechococcus sp. PCC 7336]|uniref:trigger factor n=1 Tax=Synechococcus sp. PCC 7336 TaxID=195250 RepID=UPI000345446C|nr:trigger factor [Synechococcus sp. PCC 7336]
MQVTQEKRPGSQVNLNITLDVEQVQKTYEKTVRDFTKNVQLQGFRKGKAPRQLVIQSVGSQRVKATVLESLISDSVEVALKEGDIKAIGQFTLEGNIDDLLANFNPTSELSFTGTVEVQPEVTLGKYTGLEIKVTRQEPNPDRVKETIDYQRQQRATLIPIEDRPAEMGDVATIDFVGRTLDGEEIEGARGKDFQLELEESKFIPGFVAGIVGMAIDEEREIEAEFPEDYANPDVAGQKATFTVELHELKMKELPELDDEFVSEISEFGTVEALEQHLTEQFAAEANRESIAELDEALVDAVLEGAEIDLPETLIEHEVQFLIDQNLNQLAQQGLDVKRLTNDNKMMAELQQQTRPEAIARLLRTLALSEIVRQENIQVGETELAVKVEDFLNAYRGNEKISEQRVRDHYREELLTEKVLAWLRAQNQIEWVDEDGNPVGDPTLDDSEAEVNTDSNVEVEETAASDAIVEVEASAATADSEGDK